MTVRTLEELLALRDHDAAGAAAHVGAGPDARKRVTGYQGLRDVDVIDSPEPGIRFVLDGDEVVLVYVGRAGLPEGLTNDQIAAVAGSDGTRLRSRQGKRAWLHVVADAGLAWSELDGQVAFLEAFQPTTLADYMDRIWVEPGPFIQ